MNSALLMLGRAWAPVLLAVALAFAYGSVRRVAPDRSKQLRRAWVPWVLFVATYTLNQALWLASPWDRIALITSDLLAGIAAINIAGILLFDVVLRIFRVRFVLMLVELGHAAAYIALAMLVLAARGVDVTGVLAASTVVAGILSLSLQTTLGNVIGGVAVQLDGSVEVDDWIELPNGDQGRVRTMRWRHTELETRDGDTLVVPNATLLTTNFLRLGRRATDIGPRRTEVLFEVLASVSPRKVTRVVEEALRGAPIPRVASSPPPDTICQNLAQGNGLIRYAARVWITDFLSDEQIRSDVRARVHAALERARIPMDGPQYAMRYLGRSNPDLRNRATAAVHATELFSALTPADREALVDRLDYVPFDKGEVITRQGASEDWLFVLGTGSAEVRVTVSGQERAVTRLIAPDVFGEMGLLTGEPRRATIVALERVVCWRLEKDEFDEILRRREGLVNQLSELLARRQIGLDAAAADSAGPNAQRLETERARMLDRIRTFFRLDG